MTIEQLQFFLHVLETKSINKSANDLFISQSTLSYQLRTLEKELGFELFTRASNGVLPTREALVFASGIKSACTEIPLAVQRAKAVRTQENKITIAFCCPFTFSQVGRLMDRITADFPSYKMILLDYKEEFNANPLDHGEADIAVVYKEYVMYQSNIIYTELQRSPLYALISKSHPYAQKASISEHEACALNWISIDSNTFNPFPYSRSFFHHLQNNGHQLHVTKIPILSKLSIGSLITEKNQACVGLINNWYELQSSESIVAVPIETNIVQSVGIAYYPDTHPQFIEKYIDYSQNSEI